MLIMLVRCTIVCYQASGNQASKPQSNRTVADKRSQRAGSPPSIAEGLLWIHADANKQVTEIRMGRRQLHFFSSRTKWQTNEANTQCESDT